MLRFDPNLLADEFDPAIVSMFEHENVGEQPPLDMLLTAYGQYYDLSAAYLYAKEEVLPLIRANDRADITPALLLSWLNQAHLRIAKSLAKAVPLTPGEYSKHQIIRWHWGMLTQDFVEAYLHDKSCQDKILAIASDNGLPKKNARKIIALLDKIRDLTLSEMRLKISYVGEIINPGLFKFVYAYHLRLLSSDEQATLDELAIICMPPSDYREAMRNFSEKFVRDWKQCDPNNNEQLSELLLSAYKGVAGIHPYANANGRLATWLMNVVARSLGKPSFLMREKGERFNEKSAYSEAIANIDKNPTVFKRHVLSKIEKARADGFAECLAEYKIVMERYEIFCLLQRMVKDHGENTLRQASTHALNLVQQEMIKKHGLEKCKMLEPSILLEAVNLEHSCFKTLDMMLRKKPSSSITQNSSVTACQYSTSQIDEIVSMLLAITGEGTWQAYRSGTVMLLYLADDNKANTIIKTLTDTGAMKVTLKREPSTKKPVIQLSNINLNKLKTSCNTPQQVTNPVPDQQPARP